MHRNNGRTAVMTQASIHRPLREGGAIRPPKIGVGSARENRCICGSKDFARVIVHAQFFCRFGQLIPTRRRRSTPNGQF